MSIANLHYVTAMYAPEPFNSRATSRFIWKTAPGAERRVINALPALQRCRQLLGDRMVAFVDESMSSRKEYSKAYRAALDSKIGIQPVALAHGGFWRRKWMAMLEAGKRVGWPLLWFDFLDAEVCSELTAEELAFLDKRDLVIEFETFRCFGPPLHLASGQVAPGRVRQPHTCVYLLGSPDYAEKALATNIDHDQIALATVLEQQGIYQDTPIEKLLTFSSRGLFGVRNRQPLTSHANLYVPRIVHKRGCS